MSIKLWNWEKNWACQQVFEGHTHYVMQIVINPKDNNTFATASLDRTVKVFLKIINLHVAIGSKPVLCSRSGSWVQTAQILPLKAMRKEWIVLIITMPAINLTWFRVQTTGLWKFGITKTKPAYRLWKGTHRIYHLLLSTLNFQSFSLALKMEQSGTYEMLDFLIKCIPYPLFHFVGYGIQTRIDWKRHWITAWSASGPFVVCLDPIILPLATMRDLSWSS